MLKKRLIQLMLFAGAAFVVFYVGYQITRFVFPSYPTEVAYSYTMYDSTPGVGCIFRDETVLESRRSNVLVYAVDDGSKIPNKAVVAELYESEGDALAVRRAAGIDAEIAVLEGARDIGNTTLSQLETMGKETFRSLKELQDETSRSVFDAADSALRLKRTLLQRAAVINRQIDFDGKIALLKEQKAALLQNVKSLGTVKSERSGYFVSSVDGFEDDCATAKIRDYDIAGLEALATRNPTGDSAVVGKVIEGYTWQFAAVVRTTGLRNIRVGSAVYLSFVGTGVERVPCKVTDIAGEGLQSIVYLSSDTLSRELASLRSGSIEISTKQYKGLRISARALRVVGGEKGVYIVYGQQIKFKKITVLYEGGSFLVVSDTAPAGEDAADYIKRYDEVIVEGTDLYDGKPYKP